MKYLILAGGKGSRLWPLSRKLYSKQFLNLFNDKSLLQNTALRVSKENGKDIFIISNSDSKFIIYDQMDEIFHKFNKENLIIEPIGKNTAPAIAYSLLFFNDNDIVAVLSSDHFIKDVKLFNHVLENAKDIAEDGYIATIGIVPNSPKTGYGYIKKSNKKIKTGYKVDKFVEKPDDLKAIEYIKDGNYLWNAGIFIFKVDVFIDELKKHSSQIFETLQKIKNKIKNNQEISLEDYNEFTEISVDYAIMEKTDKSVIIPADFGWNDIGSFQALYEISEKDNNGNSIQDLDKKDFINIGSNNLLVFGNKKKIGVINLNDLIIIDTADALLISDKKSSEEVKNIFNYLEKNNAQECEIHKKVYRPWGYYISLFEKNNYQVKQLSLRPLKKISLQYHLKRSETWTVVNGTAHVIIDDKNLVLNPSDSVFIPSKTKHRLYNPSNTDDLEIIEVQSGTYLGEDDIIRIDDDFKRS